MHIKIKKLHPDAVIPSYAHVGDAGMDLYAVKTIVIKPGERAQIPTGIAIELPKGFVSLVWDKSGLSHKHGLKTLGGVIDEGYRGEYMVGMINLGCEEYVIEEGHKVAQLLIQRVEHPEIEVVTELSESSRGQEGFGSTGK